MSSEIKQVFTNVKPLCDAVMVNPTPEAITVFCNCLSALRKPALQELQLYVLFPIITHLKSEKLETKYEVQRLLVDAMKEVISKTTITSLEMFEKYHTSLLSLIFDKDKPGMVAELPEELKLSITQCLTQVFLNLVPKVRIQIMKSQVPLIAQTVFIVVHIAKQDRLRSLRLSSINCLKAYTATHESLTDSNYKIKDHSLEEVASMKNASILPGLLAALQDVATCDENPGHAVIVAAVNAIHRIVCLVMNDKYLDYEMDVSFDDFAKILKNKLSLKTVFTEKRDAKDLVKKSPEWYLMAGEKLKVVTQRLVLLETHEHFKVRKELAVFCTRVLNECARTMQPSIPLVLDMLITLSKDQYETVSSYCKENLRKYFANVDDSTKRKTMDRVSENFIKVMTSLPRIVNNIESARKRTALDLLHGYLEILCDDSSPQRLTNVLSLHQSMENMCQALLETAKLDSRVPVLAQITVRDIHTPIPNPPPWRKLIHLDDPIAVSRFCEICRMLGESECVDLLVDQLMDTFEMGHQYRKEVVYVLNLIGAATKSDKSITKRILNRYLDEEMWYIPLEINVDDDISLSGTLDISVYNPRAWDRDSVPGLYEGTVETRYTGIPYSEPRIPKKKDARYCSTLGEAQNNMIISCLLTEGIGLFALKLSYDFQSYLLSTLCLVLERVGCKYEMLHMAGVKALRDVTTACELNDVKQLIRANADYFTYQITMRLKKSWNSQSALRILMVVIEFSDRSIINCIGSIVSDVLVHSCDRYHANDLTGYLKVFLAFINCVRYWYPDENSTNDETKIKEESIDLFKDLKQHVESTDALNELLDQPVGDAKTLYEEDQMLKDNSLDVYDEDVSKDRPPKPQHIQLVITILQLCYNFIPSKRRDEKILAMRVVNRGLSSLKNYEDELLPIIHCVWPPLANRFDELNEPIVLCEALDLLVAMAELSKDFIRNRTIKDVLPNLYQCLKTSSEDSYLKDVGSSYRLSHKYKLQMAALTALPKITIDLMFEDTYLVGAMDCAQLYLSNRQPKPLQALAVDFFKKMLEFDHGATWHHLRKLCKNDCILSPPDNLSHLKKVVGTPFDPVDKCYKTNIDLIFSNSLSSIEN